MPVRTGCGADDGAEDGAEDGDELGAAGDVCLTWDAGHALVKQAMSGHGPANDCQSQESRS